VVTTCSWVFLVTLICVQERAINGENLKVLNNFLDRDAAASRSHSLFGGRGIASPRDLVFYLKPQPPSCPSRVTVPLDDTVLHRLSGILHEHCNLELQPPPTSQRTEGRSPSPEEGWGGAWGHHHAQNEWARQQQHQQQQGWDYTRTRRRSEPASQPVSLDTFLKGVAQAEARESTLARRRDAAAQVEELRAALVGEWGFEGVEVRCEWGAEYVAVSLATLHAALLAHEDALHVRRGGFRGMDIVLTQVCGRRRGRQSIGGWHVEIWAVRMSGAMGHGRDEIVTVPCFFLCRSMIFGTRTWMWRRAACCSAPPTRLHGGSR
jgi:hypothetical protein